MNKNIFVYANWNSEDEPSLLGILSSDIIRGKEVFSFQYDKNWLKENSNFILDPQLQYFEGLQYNSGEKSNFGIFLDSSPDRWGRLLMKRREALIAKREGRKLLMLNESGFLLGVFDENRMGGLRFKLDPQKEFLNSNRELAAPPFATLRELEYASLKLEDEVDDENSLHWLNMLMAPGSSLGGARPKASVRDPSGNLWIAKFPSKNDDVNIGGWEFIAMEISKQVGINVANFDAQKFSNEYHTFLSQRFDRNINGKRIHFASAMTLLGYNDGADYHEGVSYLEIAEFISRNGANINLDLKELWTRIILNIGIKNTDDHLRNHGFLLSENGWILSPAYDINPNPFGSGLTLNISEDDNSLDFELALSVIDYFRLKEGDALQIINKVKSSIKNWEKLANSIKISREEQYRMKAAFDV